MAENTFIYRKRIADILLEEKLEAMGAVLIEGPKACGKTTTAEQQAKSILYMDDPTNIQQNLQLAETNIKRLLQGDTPRLIDEWQIAPQIWDAVRFEADHRKDDGLFMLTGSAVPADKSKIRHTGAGRFAWLTMRPMTLWESGESSGDVSIKALFAEPAKVDGESALKYFTDHIDSDALYLLDEPENSLSAELQLELKAVYRIFSTLLSLSVYHVHPFSVSFVHSACNSLRLGH